MIVPGPINALAIIAAGPMFFIFSIKDFFFTFFTMLAKNTRFAIILKESIRFRADKESSFIQKIKLL